MSGKVVSDFKSESFLDEEQDYVGEGDLRGPIVQQHAVSNQSNLTIHGVGMLMTSMARQATMTRSV